MIITVMWYMTRKGMKRPILDIIFITFFLKLTYTVNASLFYLYICIEGGMIISSFPISFVSKFE